MRIPMGSSFPDDPIGDPVGELRWKLVSAMATAHAWKHAKDTEKYDRALVRADRLAGALARLTGFHAGCLDE